MFYVIVWLVSFFIMFLWQGYKDKHGHPSRDVEGAIGTLWFFGTAIVSFFVCSSKILTWCHLTHLQRGLNRRRKTNPRRQQRDDPNFSISLHHFMSNSPRMLLPVNPITAEGLSSTRFSHLNHSRTLAITYITPNRTRTNTNVPRPLPIISPQSIANFPINRGALQFGWFKNSHQLMRYSMHRAWSPVDRSCDANFLHAWELEDLGTPLNQVLLFPWLTYGVAHTSLFINCLIPPWSSTSQLLKNSLHEGQSTRTALKYTSCIILQSFLDWISNTRWWFCAPFGWFIIW